MNTLQPGSLLQGGKYQIVRILGQGGFGITYEATQVVLNRTVAIKEFFMKEHCDRDAQTSHVSVPSSGSRDIVSRFRSKFLKEAQVIASCNHPNIVKILDVFEENGTAYYVMEYMPGGSLSDKIRSEGALRMSAIGYIRQIGSALDYLHSMNTLHLDVKPANILLDRSGNAVLIDFGISKHYDDAGGQTSTTPIGISKGFAPLEQYHQGDVSSFTPATDIYSLGATLFYLVTGQTPPEASQIYEDGIPQLGGSIPGNVRDSIVAAMQPRRKDRPQRVTDFLRILDGSSVVGSSVGDESTLLVQDAERERADEERKRREATAKAAKEKAEAEARARAEAARKAEAEAAQKAELERKAREEEERRRREQEAKSSDGGIYKKLFIGLVGIVLLAIIIIISIGNNRSSYNGYSQPQVVAQQQANTGSSLSSKIISFDYNVYKNGRLGYSVKYPNHMKEGTRSQNGDGARFRSPNGEANFTVYGYFNNVYMNDRTIKNEYNDVLDAYGRSTTYKVLKSNYFVVSGKKEGKIFYHVTKWKDDIGVTAILEYDEEYKASYDKACGTILNSLTFTSSMY